MSGQYWEYRMEYSTPSPDRFRCPRLPSLAGLSGGERTIVGSGMSRGRVRKGAGERGCVPWRQPRPILGIDMGTVPQIGCVVQ